MRCLTLALQARARGITTEFVCRDLPGHISHVITEQRFNVHLLPQHDGLPTYWQQDAKETIEKLAGAAVNWLIVDHYGINAHWEALLRPYATHVCVIDDLANRAHDCDVLLDQNYHPAGTHRYDTLLPAACVKLLGPHHVLLREEFHRVRKGLQRRIADVRRILVNVGGTDEANLTGLAVGALQSLQLKGVTADVVIGATNPNRVRLEHQIATDERFRMHVQTTNMADLIAAADLAIGACGATTWERCYLGLPSMGLVLSDNQRDTARQLAKAGIIYNMGETATITQYLLAESIAKLIENQAARKALSENSLALLPQRVPDLASLMLENEN